ncbi:hypothetical protein MASR2M15_01050 [Anaerolineales bacterium]
MVALNNAEEREAIGQLLEKLGADVIMVNTSKEIIHTLEDHPFDVLVMDVNLPDTHGWALLGTLRESVDISSLPIIAIMNEATVIPLDNVTLIIRPVSLPTLNQVFSNVLNKDN